MNVKQRSPSIRPAIKPLRVLFLGTRSLFSEQVLSLLVQANTSICAVLLSANSATAVANQAPIQQIAPPQTTSQLPLLTPFATTNVLTTAGANKIPVYAAQKLNAPVTAELINDLQPDVACVACFNKRIPANLLPLPRYGFWNVHPSLLPAYRGPAPLFWILRAGDDAAGVTIHQMDERFDTGNILNQQTVTLADGLSGPEADQLLAQRGAKLLIKSLQSATRGTLVGHPQPEGGSNFSWPQSNDFYIPVTWLARRAFNFMRGTAEWQRPFIIQTAQQEIVARTALAFDPDQVLAKPVTGNGRTLHIQFSPGTLTVSK